MGTALQPGNSNSESGVSARTTGDAGGSADDGAVRGASGGDAAGGSSAGDRTGAEGLAVARVCASAMSAL